MHFVAFFWGGGESREFHVKFFSFFLNIGHVLGRNHVQNIFLGFRYGVLEIFNNINVLRILCTL